MRPKRDENGKCRRLHNIVRLIKSRRLRGAGHVARMEVSRSAVKILTGKHTGRRPLGKPRQKPRVEQKGKSWLDPDVQYA